VLLDGASRNRTGDLLLAKQALSHLSYGPLTPDSTGFADFAVGPFEVASAASVPVGANSWPWTSEVSRSGSPSRRSICRAYIDSVRLGVGAHLTHEVRRGLPPGEWRPGEGARGGWGRAPGAGPPTFGVTQGVPLVGAKPMRLG